MPVSLDGKLVVAISSRAVFDFEEENRVFERDDDAAYMALQRERLEQPAPPGWPARWSRSCWPSTHRRSPKRSAGSRWWWCRATIRSAACGCSARPAMPDCAWSAGCSPGGAPPGRYLTPLKANLFLSANSDDVRAALDAGFPAARVFPESVKASESHPDEIRIAFDGDAVLFSDESEQVFQRDGLDAFQRHEETHAQRPLPSGPFMPLLVALHGLQRDGSSAGMRIRTALVTARSAPAHERAIRTLMDWGLEVDEAMFLGGLDKGPFLKAFEPDFYFDDQTRHCESAAQAGPTGHVPSGISNPPG
jgi:5'-nucleotidase